MYHDHCLPITGSLDSWIAITYFYGRESFWSICGIDRFENNCFSEKLFFEVCYLNHKSRKYKGGVTTLSQSRRIGCIDVVTCKNFTDISSQRCGNVINEAVATFWQRNANVVTKSH